MAEAVDYANIPSIVVIYEGTVTSFDNLSDKSPYYDRVVLITGKTDTNTEADKKQAIWVSGPNGDNAHFLNMSDASNLAHINGLAIETIVDGSTQNEVYNLTGGKGFIFAGDNGINISIDPNSAVDINGKPYWRIKVDAASIKEQITGIIGEGNDQLPDDETTPSLFGLKNAIGTISKAFPVSMESEYPTTGEIEAKHTLKQNSQVVGTISIPKSVKHEEIFDDNGDILSSKLPDVVLGQLKFGGLIGAAGVSVDTVPIKVKPSEKYKKHFGLDSDAAFSVNETDFLATNREGWYFIVGSIAAGVPPKFTWNDVSYSVGDWFLSTGSEWVKIDNTDAVTSVADKTGAVTVEDITGRDDETTETLGASLDKADSAIQHLRAGEPSGLNWKNDEYITVGKLPSSSAFNEETGEITATIKTNTETIGNAIDDTSKKGLATAEDIAAYLKARLSVKVVQAN